MNSNQLNHAASEALQLRSMDESLLIALPLDGGQLAEHFGHCGQFAFIESDARSGTITRMVLRDTPAHRPGLLPLWLRELGVRVVIASGLGRRAVELFREYQIEVRCGRPGASPEKLIQAFHGGCLSTLVPVCTHEGCHS